MGITNIDKTIGVPMLVFWGLLFLLIFVIGIRIGEECDRNKESLDRFVGVGSVVDNHEAVDLGLSVKWATCNVGASSPEEYGDHYAWGETETKAVYDWNTYKWCKGSFNKLTKYTRNDSAEGTAVRMKLDLTDDAAHVHWGGSWRMPTRNEFHELRENCEWTWTTLNGVKGYKVTSKSTGHSIFLPPSGRRYGSRLNDVGRYGYYWTSSLYKPNPALAWYADFGFGSMEWSYSDRAFGRTVRPVCP